MNMRSMFQSIMYRIFRSKRGDIALFSKVLNLLAFNKESNCLLGLVMKSVLLRKSFIEPYHGFQGSIYEEFPFLTEKELYDNLEECA